MNRLILMGLLAVVVSIGTSSFAETTYLSENLESSSLGPVPSDYPTGHWYHVADATNPYNVVDTATVPAPATGGTHMLSTVRTPSSTATYLRLYMDTPVSLETGLTYSVSFDVRWNSSGILFTLSNTSSGSNEIAYGMISNGGIYYKAWNETGDTGTVTYSGKTLAADTWAHVDITVDVTGSDHESILVDMDITPEGGSKTNIFTDNHVRNTVVLGNDFLISMAPQGTSSITYWDNFLVTSVPEPATLSLLMLGMFGLRFIRRRS